MRMTMMKFEDLAVISSLVQFELFDTTALSCSTVIDACLFHFPQAYERASGTVLQRVRGWSLLTPLAASQ